MLQRGDTLELEIIDVAFGGSGIAKPALDDSGKSFVVFVEQTVPGDRVMAQVYFAKKQYAEASVVKFLKFSPERIAPRCSHFGKKIAEDGTVEQGWQNPKKNCGGCTLQFMPYEGQLHLKQKQVQEAMERLGGIQNLEVRPVIGLENPWYYRNKMEFSFGRDKNNEITLGLHMRGRHHDLTELDECYLMQPYLGELVKFFRDFFKTINLGEKPVTLKSLTIRQGINTGEILLMLQGENGQPNFLPEFQNAAQDFFSQQDLNLAALLYEHTVNMKGYSKKRTTQVLYGKPDFQEKLRLAEYGELQFNIAPEAFFQPNTLQAEKLYQEVLQAAELKGQEKVFDLYCGTGTIALAAALKAKQVIGIELNEKAIESARTNAALNNLNNVEFFAGDVSKVLKTINQKADIIIVDPPRAGMHEDAVALLLQLQPARLVYVSCNPTTLARDAKMLIEGGYTLHYVQPIDQFCHTYHIENVAVFSKSN